MSKTGQSCWNGRARSLAAIIAVCLVAVGLIIGAFRFQAKANATEHKVFITEHTAIRADASDLSERMAVVETLVDVLNRVDKNVKILVQRPAPAPASPASDR